MDVLKELSLNPEVYKVDSINRTRNYKHGELKKIIESLEPGTKLNCANKNQYQTIRRSLYLYGVRFYSKGFSFTIIK